MANSLEMIKSPVVAVVGLVVLLFAGMIGLLFFSNIGGSIQEGLQPENDTASFPGQEILADNALLIMSLAFLLGLTVIALFLIVNVMGDQ